MQKKPTSKTPLEKPTTPKKEVVKTIKATTVSKTPEKPATPKRTSFNKELKATPAPTVKPPVKPTTRKPAAKKTTPKTPAKKPTARKTPAKPAEVEVKKVDGRIGNQFWMNRAKHGRDKLFATPELLWQAACEYFRWIEENPLYETKVFQFQGVVVTKEVPIMRAMTMAGLCFYLNCNETYFRQFKANLPDGEIGFSSVITDIENVVYRQKFEGAAGNLLNANIISRDLGLADKKDISSNGETLSFTNFLIQSSEEDEE
ncbi:terminase small subunit [Chryseobacterium indoltheticum]|nr:terminase small subunit [Chryseobacterium indoltheticum]